MLQWNGKGENMAEMKVNVDMSELDEALDKAKRLLALVEEIEARLEAAETDLNWLRLQTSPT